jgi:hypothetical protein
MHFPRLCSFAAPSMKRVLIITYYWPPNGVRAFTAG